MTGLLYCRQHTASDARGHQPINVNRPNLLQSHQSATQKRRKKHRCRSLYSEQLHTVQRINKLHAFTIWQNARFYTALRGMAVQRWEFCLSVCLSNACIVAKRKKDLSSFLYHTKDGWWGSGGRPLLPEILGQPTPAGAKSPILNRYSLTALQP